MRIFKYLFSIFMIASICSCHKKDNLPVGEANIFAEQEVYLREGRYACQSDIDFSSAMEHELNKEYSAMGIVLNEPACIWISSTDANQVFTVLSVKGQLSTIGITTAKQYMIDPEKNKRRSDRMYITATSWLRPVLASSGSDSQRSTPPASSLHNKK